jgi:deazaflavin-dependent oxidoreductase (nitroreductase family)
MNDQVIKEFRETGGKPGGYFAAMNLLLLTTTGAKSGQERVSPVAYTQDGGDYIVIASYGGNDKHPAWFHNLQANPHVTVEVGTDKFDASAKVVESADERRRLYDAQAALYPTFKDYETKTDRVIPVVRLVRADKA